MSVTPAMIAVALGVAAPTTGFVQEQQWQMWIDDALMLIDARKTELGVTTDLDPARLDFVVREATVAQVRRPDDATQVTTSVDDGSVSRTYRSAKGRIEILDEWWSLLGLTPSGGQAFDIDRSSSTSPHVPWCSFNMGATYCSCGADIANSPLYETGGYWL